MSAPPPTGPSTVVNVSVLIGVGSGTFAPPVPYFVGTRDFHDVAAGDFDGDHKPDLVVATQPSVVVLLNNGNGTFADKVEYPSANIGRAVVVADLNGDGKIDLATANNNSSDMSILLGNGNGTFGASVEYYAGGLPTSLAGGDFNADGRLDFVISAGPNATVGLFTGIGDGTFAAVVGTFTGGSATLASGDFDGDGKADVATATLLGHRVLLSRCR